ncbi:MAG: translation initiation factor IF-2 N-terminal domain-containing protein, partial [Ruminococcus sp.]|nr:translation initiation factor IF-2 N-terminal domain-containing protein [Ruminococcus sp.]
MAKKIKLSDAAKDLSVSSQELINYFAERGDTKKKAASALTEDEMNLLLEHYSKLHEVSSFDDYFKSKDQPKPVKTEEEKRPAPEKKAPAKKQEKKPAAPKKQEEKKPEAAPAPKKEEKVQETAPAAPKKEEKPQEAAPAPRQEEKAPEAAPVQNAETIDPAKKTKKNDKKEKQQAKAQDRGERTKFNASFSSETAQTSTQRRTVDTRGSYVDLDKYNERYEQIAPANKHKNDNYSSKKQKINQKSAQRTRQQYSRKETESEKLKRLELERARK